MDLKTYLERKDETTARFSRRAGVLYDTMKQIRDGKTRCRIDLAKAIVEASKAEPTQDGEWVDYPDLIPERFKSADVTGSDTLDRTGNVG